MKCYQRITLYESTTHPVYGGKTVNHDKPVFRHDPRQIMKVPKHKDVHRLVSECEAEKASNSISVRYLFGKKLSRKERKKHRL